MSTDSGIRVGVRSNDLSPEHLRYLRQIGVCDVFVDHVGEPAPHRLTITPDSIPTVEDLAAVKARLEDAGLRFAGVQSLSGEMYDAIMFGEGDAAAQTEAIATLIERLGAADVPILGYQGNPRARNVVFSTGTEPVRGGAEARAFDLDAVDDPGAPEGESYDEAAFWDRYEAFLDAVLPVAEDAGVRLALHPADPPVIERLAGIPRLFRDVDSFNRAMAAHPSDAHGLKLCLGCFSEMGEDVVEVIRHFGDDIVFVHFRDVVGSMPRFRETFVDEGTFDAYAAMRALREVGFDGVVVPDHVPTVEGDTGWGHRARGYTVGYLRGLAAAVNRE